MANNTGLPGNLEFRNVNLYCSALESPHYRGQGRDVPEKHCSCFYLFLEIKRAACTTRLTEGIGVFLCKGSAGG